MGEDTAQGSFPHQEVISSSLKDVLSSACGIDASLLEKDEEALDNGPALIVIISLVGDVEWSMCLGFPQETAINVAEKFFGMPLEFESPDMSDCLGEIGNIFAGDVKAKLDECGISADISLPSVIRGVAIKILVGRGSPYEAACLDSDSGKLWYEVVSGKNVVPTRAAGS